MCVFLYNSVEKWEIVGNQLLIKMIGNYSNKLDDKARLTIPAKFRDELGSSIVASYGFDNTIEIRTSKSFEIWMKSLTSKGNLSKNARQLSRVILGNSFELTLDKAGRVLLPKPLIKLIGLDKEVTLIGIGDKIEVHPTKQWDNITSDTESMAKSLEEIAEALNNEE